jgi:uncharacterized membrane protein
MRIRAITLPLLAAALAAAGCGSSSSSSSTSTSTPAATGTAPAATDHTYAVSLRGANEVPKGSPTGSGTAKISLEGSKGQVCWTFTLVGVPHPSVSHIHSAAAGVSGPVFIPLGGVYKPTGCTSAPKAEIAAIVAAPAKYYVNVHNAKYPNGAIRAQL